MTEFRLPSRHPAFASQKRFKRSWWRAASITVGVMVVLVALCGAGWLIWQKHQPKKPIPRQYLKGLNFQIFYPYHLPSGFEVNSDSFTRRGNVLIFAIKQLSDGKSIAVTEEAKPTDVNLDEQSPVQLPTDKNFFTPVGHATISQWSANTVSSLVTDQTWVILNVDGIDPGKAQNVTASFVRL